MSDSDIDLDSLLASTDLAVLFLDTRFQIRRFTPRTQELLEIVSTDVGRPVTDLARKFDDPRLLVDAKQVLEQQVPSEREISTRDGRWFVRRITPCHTAEDRLEGVVITFFEITKWRLAEDDLRKSEERLRQAIERAPVPIVMLAENNEVLQLNHAWAELTGYSSEEVPLLESLLAIVDPEEAATFRSQLRDVFRGAIATLRLDLTIRTRAGEARHWNFTASSPGALPDGRRTCVGMAVDITERVRALRELQRSKDAVEAASAMKDQFLANVSHELRTPLSVTLLWSKLLARGDVGADQKERAIDAIIRSAEAQSRLIDDLLDSTRIVSGKLRVTLKPVDLRRVIGAAVEVVRPLAINKSIEIGIEITKPVGVVQGDSMRLEQIVWNLLSNAVKFTPQLGTIRLALMREGDSMVVSVVDDGVGVAPEFLPQIFQPFAQGDENRGTRTGLGLGLSIARSLAQLHGGSITAHSDGLGKGATFTLRLPVVAGDADALALEGPGDDSRMLGGIL